VILRGRHLDDERLFACYIADRHGERPDVPGAEHVARCSRCRERYGDIVRFMDEIRAEADEEVDALFPPERLSAQQHLIARRIEQLGHSARVITFPGPLAARHELGGAARGPRWIAAAAAAGLLVGAAVGTFYDGTWRVVPRRHAPQEPVRIEAPLTPAASPLARTDTARLPAPPDDEALLTALELAIGGPRNKELLPFDAMTPRAADISVQLR
jgi:hypothetical protein